MEYQEPSIVAKAAFVVWAMALAGPALLVGWYTGILLFMGVLSLSTLFI